MAEKAPKNPVKTLPQKPVKDAILDAALSLAAQQGWAYTLVSDIAAEAELSLAALYDEIAEKGDVLILLGRRIDKQTLEAVGAPDPSVSERDRLFDILMERYDVLNQNRAAIISILESFKSDPKELVISFPHLGRSMSWMLHAAGLETSGVRGALRVAGLTGLYLKTLRIWQEDDSADMAKVMAALDKDLGRIEGWAARFGF